MRVRQMLGLIFRQPTRLGDGGGDIKGSWELWSQACLDLNFTFATLRLGKWLCLSLWASLVAQLVKNQLAMQETWV